MAGVVITADVAAVRMLRAARLRCSDAEPWRQIGEHMLRSVAENFEGGGRPDRWVPLKTETLIGRVGGARRAYKRSGALRAKAARYIADHKVLVQSGRLLRSVSYRAASNGCDVGTPVVYAATHQFGRSSGRGAPIPARPFLVMQDGDRSAAAQILERYIAGGM
jgi:phage gpG-like protein